MQPSTAPPNPVKPPIMVALKARTQAQHEALEGAVGPFDAVETLPQYRALLSKLWGFHAPVEAALVAFFQQAPELASALEFSERCHRRRWLTADLSASGLSEADIQGLPRCDAILPIQSAAEALGTLYVLEGSTLGGQMMTRHFEARLSITREQGLAFFSSYGDQVGPRWKQLCVVLDDYSQRHDEDEVIIQAACQTFERIRQWFLAA